MAQLVSVMATTHNPRICWNRDDADPQELKRLFDSFGVLREGLARAKPDAILFVANDHLDNFFFDNQPAFAIASGPEVEGPFWYEAEVMHLPRYRATVHCEMAQDLLRTGLEEGIAFTQTAECQIDHAFTLPLSLLRPEQDIPVVPIITNVFGYPILPNKRWFELGRFLREFVAQRPAHERIAIAASFNLTVEVGGPKMGNYNRAFSDMLIELMSEGDADTMLETLTVPRLIAEGNSTAEFLNYFAILGVMGNRKPTYISHKPVPGVGTCPVVMWDNP